LPVTASGTCDIRNILVRRTEKKKKKKKKALEKNQPKIKPGAADVVEQVKAHAAKSDDQRSKPKRTYMVKGVT
jgi:hypothetical protein